MTGPRPTFEIHESRTSGFLRLVLTGELDHFGAPILEDRLTRLRARRSPVRLDLSNLESIGSTGIRLLVQSVGDARIKGWEFQIEPDVSPKVMSVFRLVHLERFVGYSTSAHPSGAVVPDTSTGELVSAATIVD